MIKICDAKTNGFEVLGNTNKTVVAGELINLTLDIPDPHNELTNTEGNMNTKYRWVLPGYTTDSTSLVIASYNTDLSSNPVTALDDGDLTNDSVSFYFTAGSAQDVTVICKLTIQGQEQDITATLHVEGPTGTMTGSQTNPVQNYASLQGHLYEATDYVIFGALGGTVDSLQKDAGITVNFSEQDPADFSGKANNISQIIEHQGIRNKNNVPSPYPDVNNYLDRAFVYPVQTSQQAWDAPAYKALDSSYSPFTVAGDKFNTYLMWLPDLADSIWVPVCRLDWSWTFTDSNTGVGDKTGWIFNGSATIGQGEKCEIEPNWSGVSN